MKYLVIVESPAKSKTIKNYLGKEFVVASSVGHIRDLATTGKYGFGVDVEHDFAAEYKTISGKTKVIKELKQLANGVDYVYLATDPDREGEAISWHLADVLGLPIEQAERVVFNEITKKAVQDAFKHPRKIDMDLVHSQEARRILDRIIGFRLSKLLQTKIKSKSAGRVQSVALKLIVEREREIIAFIPREYWEIHAKHELTEDKVISFKLVKYQNKKIELKNEADAIKVMHAIEKEPYTVIDVTHKQQKRAPKKPFITSSLQQEAANKLGFSAKKTMMVAQKLYEGLKIGKELVGLITYMRTDSTRLSDDFVKETFTFIEQTYGKAYCGKKMTTKQKETAQDAHEGIRPTDVHRTPDEVAPFLTKDELALYRFIWTRTVASLMKSAEVDNTKVLLNNQEYQFQATGQVLIFDGYLNIYKEYESFSKEILPDYQANQVVHPITAHSSQHFTQPPARFSEASLVKILEEEGIGRPSTYATILDTIQKRGYVQLEQKRFIPTEQGILTNDKLVEHFPDLINVKYTAEVEHQLDEIAQGKLEEIGFLRAFYHNFEPLVLKAFENMETIAPKETGELCPECGSPLVVRRSRYGEFIGCSNYPECKYIKPKEENTIKSNIMCPKCKEGHIVPKRTKRSKIFYGCDRYPDCDFATWYEPLERPCDKCGGLVVQKGKKQICLSCESEQ